MFSKARHHRFGINLEVELQFLRGNPQNALSINSPTLSVEDYVIDTQSSVS